jgi:hypothetical protein
MNAAIGIVTRSFDPAAADTKPGIRRSVQGKHQGECKACIKVGAAR